MHDMRKLTNATAHAATIAGTALPLKSFVATRHALTSTRASAMNPAASWSNVEVDKLNLVED